MSLQLSANPAKTKLRTAVSKQNWRPTQATHRHRQISRLRRGSLGDWITCEDGGDSWSLISPDGKTQKPLGKIDTDYLTFSKDEKQLYGILNSDPKTSVSSAILFSLDPATLRLKMIRDLGIEFKPDSSAFPGIRFSMAPDGKSFLYSTGKRRQDIWMLQGFKQPSWLHRFAFR